ncbi:DUF7144 family membrane protein [Actinacidiphila sp. ITFR-21]|uniref:DUF7144 family membrane protein n=1 Tax=Actinacidiphila sp. ITFR-21 TaxID=3075199 RepID=UPI00288927C0|nr:hypothetical protein [Streptomyces sp. ITFR-21]WNI16085.1 hypothetical protein RLT57_11450 [Streptomyces sp. ITFR-21]
MSQQDPPTPPPSPGPTPPGSTGPTPAGPTAQRTPAGGRHPHTHPGAGGGQGPWAAGGTLFAGTMLLFAGVLAVLEGIAGIARDVVYVRTRGSYTYEFDVRAWGWIHFALGIVAVLVGAGVLRGAGWARLTGILIAGLSMVANFIFLPYQPVWSVIMVAIDVFVIWALATHHPSRAQGGPQ